ncbi:MAG: hypothetical protein R3F43_31270 [bacterium]
MKFFIDLGLGAAYQAEGRDCYSELFDALALGQSSARPIRPRPAAAPAGATTPQPQRRARRGPRRHHHGRAVRPGAREVGHRGVLLRARPRHGTPEPGPRHRALHQQGEHREGHRWLGRVEDPTSPRYNPAEHNSDVRARHRHGGPAPAGR